MATSISFSITSALLDQVNWANAGAALEHVLLSAMWRTRLALLAALDGASRHTQRVLDHRLFHTTLQIVVAHHQWLGVAQIGDGFVVAETDKSIVQLITPRREVEYANETEFITDQRLRHPTITIIEDAQLSGFAVATDGLAQIALEYEGHIPCRPKAGFFSPLFDGVGSRTHDSARLMRILRSPQMVQECDDDLTLIVATLPRGAASRITT
ncbi:hypothetical protein JOD57_000024 [Geodermatophilus bullaregiensis]|nr:hypothetical protein [Geodermatophilus bullaregiensis]